MAQYTITAACGHTTTLQLYGPVKERERRMAWMEGPGGMCNACYAAHKRAEEADYEERAIEAEAAPLRAHAAEITPEVAARWRAQIAAGKGQPRRNAAIERVLAELGM